MSHYFPRGPLENRVLKTRFIIQKNFKNLPSPKHGLTSLDRIRSERESDQREGDRIRERERVRSERDRKRSRGSRGLGCATQVRDLGSHDLGVWPTRSLSLPLWSDYFSLFYLVSLSLIWLSLWSDPIRWGEAVLGTWRFLKFFWIINRVFKTRFSSGPHGK